MRFWYSFLLILIFQLLTTTAQAQVPSCAGSGDEGNSYESCASGWCERLVCDGTAFNAEYIRSTSGQFNPDLGNDTSTCNTDRKGRLRFTGSAVQVCTGSNWVSASASGAMPVDADLATSPAGQIISINGGADNFLSYKGTDNLFLGSGSGDAVTTGSSNTALGSQAATALTKGSYNVAVGTQALSTNKGRQGSTAIGWQAMYNANDATGTTLTENTAVGRAALQGPYPPSGNTGTSNTAIGAVSLINNTNGSQNSGLGQATLYSNTTGDNNTAVGYHAGYNNTTANSNTFIGYNAGSSVTTPCCNVLIGTNAASDLTTGSDNIILGEASGVGLVTGAGNIILGGDTYPDSTATRSVVLGYNAGGAGNRVILIGAGVNRTASSYSINIGNVIYGTTGTSDATADAQGDNSASLRVDGSLQLGTSSETCNASNGGRMRYNSGTKKMQYCNETAWTDM